MTTQGRFIFGWFVVIILVVSLLVGVVAVYNCTNKKERSISGLMCFTSIMALILVSNSLVI